MWPGVFIGILLFLAALLHFTRRPKNFPPGPFSWPVVGNIFQFGTELHKTLIKMKANYGEIFAVSIGTTRLPFVEAVSMEALRYSSILPVGLGRSTLEDIEFHGYQIPKGTLFMGNHYGVHHDPKIWGDPENFRPERFLSPDGQSVVRHEAFIPFSTGKRACPGETLAKDELFLFTAAIFQRFRMEFDPNSPKPELGHSVQTIIVMPKKHKIVIHDRLQ